MPLFLDDVRHFQQKVPPLVHFLLYVDYVIGLNREVVVGLQEVEQAVVYLRPNSILVERNPFSFGLDYEIVLAFLDDLGKLVPDNGVLVLLLLYQIHIDVLHCFRYERLIKILESLLVV